MKSTVKPEEPKERSFALFDAELVYLLSMASNLKGKRVFV